jgi:hypothetical protein
LKAKLLELVKARDLEFGIIIRRLSNNRATQAYRVFPDGHEELLRDARIGDVTPASFKDIVSVSTDRAIYTTGSSTGLGALGGEELISYAVPGMLFEDLSVEHVPNDSPKPPVVESPLAAN